MTWLAEVTLDAAWQQVVADLDDLYGAPQTAAGQRAEMWIVGMGKLGARELNVSSDIDLIYVYDDDGETAGNAEGRNRISNHEYFAKLVRQVQALIGDTTEHGFVFRVDLALRPNGNSGPSVVSLGALEEYLLVQGREWERFAWMKSRVVAPRSAVRNGSAQQLRGVVLPFVFRRYLDYNVFESLRVLHRQIREHATRRSAGRPERANDVKLSRGGIREIEFTVQLLQVVRGGQFPELRTRPTLEALQRVARGRPDAPGHGARPGPGLRAAAAHRAPHPVPGRPADAPAADGGCRPGLDRALARPGRRRRRRPGGPAGRLVARLLDGPEPGRRHAVAPADAARRAPVRAGGPCGHRAQRELLRPGLRAGRPAGPRARD